LIAILVAIIENHLSKPELPRTNVSYITEQPNLPAKKNQEIPTKSPTKDSVEEDIPATVAAAFSMNEFYISDESGYKMYPGETITVSRGTKVTARWSFFDGSGTMTRKIQGTKSPELIDVVEWGEETFIADKTFTLEWKDVIVDSYGDSYAQLSKPITVRVKGK